MSNSENEIFSYKDSEKILEAIKIFDDIKKLLLDKYPDTSVSIVHMASCLIEETCGRFLPPNESGTLLLETARALAPEILNQINIEEQMKMGIFEMPGSNSIQ